MFYLGIDIGKFHRAATLINEAEHASRQSLLLSIASFTLSTQFIDPTTP